MLQAGLLALGFSEHAVANIRMTRWLARAHSVKQLKGHWQKEARVLHDVQAHAGSRQNLNFVAVTEGTETTRLLVFWTE